MKITNPKIISKIKKLAKGFGLNFIVLFGSQVQKTIHTQSDIDVAISSKKDLSPFQEAKIQLELSKIFRRPDIDLVSTRDASPLLLHRIAFNSQLLAESTSHSFSNFQIYAFKRYVEAKPLFKIIDKYINYD